VPGFTLADCDPLSENGLARELRWKGKALADCTEKEVRVLFRLEKAELFTFDLNASPAR